MQITQSRAHTPKYLPHLDFTLHEAIILCLNHPRAVSRQLGTQLYPGADPNYSSWLALCLLPCLAHFFFSLKNYNKGSGSPLLPPPCSGASPVALHGIVPPASGDL